MNEIKTRLSIQKIFENAVRLYFAPIAGAFKAVQSEVQRISREQHKDNHQHVM